MKKVAYFLTLIFAVALLSTSCCKDDPIPDPDGITVSDLDGVWTFQSLNFVDVLHNTTVDGEYNTPTELSALNKFYDFVQLNFNFTSTSVTLSSTYLDEYVNGTGNWSNSYPYVLDGTLIKIDGNYLQFEIMNADTFDGNQLLLKLNVGNTDMPIGGIYTLQ